jgi:UDP-N-acetylglucosamine diphosphorylase/glucosamine-1-phosphate N-acetyltransferase
MNIGYFEDDRCERLLPLTWLRAAFELRCGYDRLIDKVRRHCGRNVARMWTRPLVHEVVRQRVKLDPVEATADWCLLNARVFVTGAIELPQVGVAWKRAGQLIAAGVSAANVDGVDPVIFTDPARQAEWLDGFRFEEPPENVQLIQYPWHLIHANEHELERQFGGGGPPQGQVYTGAHLVQSGAIHIGNGARIKPGAVLDAEGGPIHIDDDVLVQPNAVIEGPCYIGPRSTIRPGAAIRPGTSIGPVCKVGGEVEGSIIHGHANKQHDGFLGHSYIAEWVNLGADTITSDLKNTYGGIRVYLNGVGVESGSRFLGSIIGDHSKTGIGTILPTGCVMGVSTHVFTSSGVPRFVPSFGWLTDQGLTECRLDKGIQIARTVMGRRDIELSDAEERLLQEVAGAARRVEAAGWA